MSGRESDNDKPSGANGLSRLARYVYWGTVVGLAGALAMLFVVVYFYGKSLGLGTGECVVFSCVLTLLLSQPAGLIGLLAGAGAGAVFGFIGHRLRAR